MNHEIRIYGNPVLREKARPVAAVDDDLRQLAAEMVRIMHASEGVGLAAQQIGETRAICVIDMPPDYDEDGKGGRHNPDVAMPLVLINPVLSEPTEETDVREEGCLSFPEIRANITRPVEVSVAYLDEQGQPKKIRAREFLARVIQHEVDHLNGVLFIDRMSAPKRIALSGKLRRMKRETEEGLEEKAEM